MKKALTGEGMKLVKAEGIGRLYCADESKVVCVLELVNQSLFVNGNDVLALSGSLQYDIKFLKSAGMLSGGLFNIKVGCALAWLLTLVELVTRSGDANSK